MSPYTGTESVVGGRAVDDRWGKGMSKIGNALISKFMNKRSDEKEKELSDKYDVGRKAAIEKVMASLNGRGAVGEYGPQQPIAPDRTKAGLILGTNQYLQGNSDLAKALLDSEMMG